MRPKGRLVGARKAGFASVTAPFSLNTTTSSTSLTPTTSSTTENLLYKQFSSVVLPSPETGLGASALIAYSRFLPLSNRTSQLPFPAEPPLRTESSRTRIPYHNISLYFAEACIVLLNMPYNLFKIASMGSIFGFSPPSTRSNSPPNTPPSRQTISELDRDLGALVEQDLDALSLRADREPDVKTSYLNSFNAERGLLPMKTDVVVVGGGKYNLP